MTCRYRYLTVFLVLAGLITACGAPAASPAAAPRTYRIGYLGGGGDPRPAQNNVAFVEELARLGYTPGHNLTIEYRWAEGKSERLAELARESATLNLDALLASGELPAQALLEAAIDLPIVMVT